MPFENISKRKLSFAPKNLVLAEDQKELKIALNETNFSSTERIIALNKMIFLVSSGKGGEFEKLPELNYIEGNLSIPEGCTVLFAKLTQIVGDLNIGPRSRFYAPFLQEVTGYIYVGTDSVVKAPKIEPMLVNDDAGSITSNLAVPDWLA